MNRLILVGSTLLALVGFGAAHTISPGAQRSAQAGTHAGAGTSRLERGIVAIGFDAWAGSDPAALSRMTDFAVFHAPQPGPDESARQAYEAADPTSRSFVYQNFGFACEIESWTTCGFTSREARSRSFLARYDGQEVVLEGVRRALDAGKPGYGAAVAEAFIARLAALSPRPDGVFIDDVNVIDDRLPRNGVPDGYTVATYRAALKTQLAAAVAVLARSGYQTMANLGGIQTGEIELSGVADFTFVEFCGTWADGTAQHKVNGAGPDLVTDRIKAAIHLTRSRGGRSICQFFRATEAPSRLDAQLSGIFGADAVAIARGNDYRGPFAVPTVRGRTARAAGNP